MDPIESETSHSSNDANSGSEASTGSFEPKLLEQEVEPELPQSLFRLGVIVEGGLVLLALTIAYFGFYDRSQPLNELLFQSSPGAWGAAAIWGLVGTLPLVGYLVVFHYWSPSFMNSMKEFVGRQMKPMFAHSSLWELGAISVMAGIGEELFFRWCLQGGLQEVLADRGGDVAAVLIASLVFGLMHFVTLAYFVSTSVVGIYLGWMMIASGSFVAPAIAHALFDFIALIYIARHYPDFESTDVASPIVR